jgi:RHS repeat-associated protein
VIDTVSYDYYMDTQNKGRLKWLRQGNKDGSITTTYSNYTTAGLYKQKSVSASNCPTCTTRTETFTYDNTQRFVTQAKNPKNHTVTFTYSSKTGNKFSETDPNGLTTSYQYDYFGNLKKITYPNGTYTTITTNWYSDSHLPNAKYKTITASAGKPELTVYYDMLGREICRKDDGYYFKTIYNTKGEVVKTMGPHGAFNSPESEGITHTCLYDVFGRKTGETAPYTNLVYDYQTQGRKVTVTHNGVSSWKDYDALGRITSAGDNGGSISYAYGFANSGSNLKHATVIKVNNTETTTILSDMWGNRLSIEEPNAGLITSEYNKFNELVKQTDAKGNITTYQYDILGRVTQKQFTAPNVAPQTIDYVYDSRNMGIGKLAYIMVNNILTEEFRYNALSRLNRHTQRIDGDAYNLSYTYTPNGQLKTLNYAGNFVVSYSYTSSGKLNEIRRTDDNSNSLIYKVNLRNKYNATISCEYGNEVRTEYEYNPYGLLTHIQTGNKVKDLPYVGNDTAVRGNSVSYKADSAILNYRYAYNTKGLMSSRSETVLNQMESYTYDNLDRLTAINYGATQQTFIYQNNNGNILANSQVGTYTYGSKPHAVTQITPINNSVISANQCEVTYNFFNQPTQIIEGAYQLDLYYGANQQRHKAVKKYGTIEDTCYYISKYFEVKKNAAGACLYHYIYGDNGVVALYLSTPYVDTTSGGGGGQQRAITDSMYYIHTDHLGSYCAITSPSKMVVQRNYFDPWGNYPIIYPPTNGKGIGLPPGGEEPHEKPTLNFTLTNRGFTGHEHYPEVKIINMNGRLYDPVIARFFSPDKYVANSSFTQDFNRYSYCRNNPLMYTDPDGEFINFIVGAIAGGLMNWAMNGFQFNLQGLGYFGIGAAAGVASAGIGVMMAGAVGTLGFASGAITAGSAGFVGGFISGTGNSLMQGNSLEQGWLSGLKAGGIGALTAGIMGGIQGGCNAWVNGGNFWTGAGATFDVMATMPSSDAKYKVGDGMEYSTDYAKKFSNKYFNQPKGLRNLHANGSYPSSYYSDDAGECIYRSSDNREVWGTAAYRGFGKTDVYLYKGAFTSMERLYITMRHEYLHVGYNTVSGFWGLHEKQHANIYKTDYEQARLWNFDVKGYESLYYPYRNSTTHSVLNPANFGMPPISIRPWLLW